MTNRNSRPTDLRSRGKQRIPMLGIQRNTKEYRNFFEALMCTEEYLKASYNTMVKLGIPRNTEEYKGIRRNT